ncbi:pleckstrin (PH) domain-containing protein [Tieghemostelium lacteum]|uniref:Pleckstrin (PH) domain-containing protein n=1 Tax=Tieghemostelium lacteum TaxID=361077 RepID=A0A151ZE16_TIELA|nr:pleckstrin (PH) domain-containing protein [Tieghemostelium lacteum]|eukprot:KYQ92196.1 pleckstrin (PH) domain-containing protein [Tieghemostelium lacteum]
MAQKKNRNKKNNNNNLKNSNEPSQQNVKAEEEENVKSENIVTETTNTEVQSPDVQLNQIEKPDEVQVSEVSQENVDMNKLFQCKETEKDVVVENGKEEDSMEFSTITTTVSGVDSTAGDSLQSNVLSLGDSFSFSQSSVTNLMKDSNGVPLNQGSNVPLPNNQIMKDLWEFLEIYKTTAVPSVSNEDKESHDWKQLYFTVSKQLNLERSKTETLESLVLQRDQENQQLKDQIKQLEFDLVNERKKLNKTVGTIRNGTKKLTVKLGNNIDVATILEELNAGVDQSISSSNTISEGLATITSEGISSDQLLSKLNSFGGTLRGSQSHGSAIHLLSASKSTTFVFSKEDIKKITLVQSLVRRWIAKKVFKKLKLLNLNNLETKRTVIAELFETERTYVARIKDLLKIFVNPLKQKVKNEMILQPDEIDTIFSSISMIYKCNSIFLDRIEEIYLKFNKWLCFGEKILEQIPLFECYIDYIINYEYAQKTLKKLTQSSKALSEFIKAGENKPELDDLDIGDLMIMPVQRIPRYIMLFKEIRKYTPIHHADYQSIDKALEAFKHFAMSINEKSHARKKCLQLEDRILGYKDDLTSNSRYLVREGALKFKKNNEYVFLFNDMIVVCHPTLKKTKSKTLSNLPTINATSTSNLGATLTSSNSSSASSSSTSQKDSASPSSPTSSPQVSRTSHDTETETTFKFVTKINLDARVKIVQDPTEPKFLVIIPDDSRVEFVASSLEERLHWVQDIMMIVSVFSSHILNQPINPLLENEKL